MNDARARALMRLAALTLLVGALFAAIALSGPLSSARVRSFTGRGSGLDVAVVFVAISASLTVACFPGPLLAAASGILFGTAAGTLISIIAAVLGAVAAFSLARRIAGDAVLRIGGARVRRIAEVVGRRGFISVLYARIVPGAPYTLVNYAGGLSPVKLGDFTLATAIGVAPRAFAYTALGGSFRNLTSPEALVAVGVLVAMALLGLALGVHEAGGPRGARDALRRMRF